MDEMNSHLFVSSIKEIFGIYGSSMTLQEVLDHVSEVQKKNKEVLRANIEEANNTKDQLTGLSASYLERVADNESLLEINKELMTSINRILAPVTENYIDFTDLTSPKAIREAIDEEVSTVEKTIITSVDKTAQLADMVNKLVDKVSEYEDQLSERDNELIGYTNELTEVNQKLEISEQLNLKNTSFIQELESDLDEVKNSMEELREDSTTLTESIISLNDELKTYKEMSLFDRIFKYNK